MSKETLILQEREMICEHEKVKPVSLIISPKGERIIDFGQNLAGDVFESYSAGTETKPQINQDAVRLMKEIYGIDIY